MGNAPSHVPNKLSVSQENILSPPSPTPIFPFKTIFVINSGELGLFDPQRIAFKMPLRPNMHYAQDDSQLDPEITAELTVPRNFWPKRAEAIEIDLGIPDPKHLLLAGHERKHVTLHLMRYGSRSMIPNMKDRIEKLQHISDFIITFMLNPEAEDIGKISKQDFYGIPNGVLFQCRGHKVLPQQVPVYINLLLNPTLISMRPEDFDSYVKICMEAQKNVDSGLKQFDIPREMPNVQATQNLFVGKVSSDEIKVSWTRRQMSWSQSDWIGIFRPHCVQSDRYIAKFIVQGTKIDKENTDSLVVKIYPVPYGEIVFRYFRSDSIIADSVITSFGADIKLVVAEQESGLNAEVSGDLPPCWSLSVANEEGEEVLRARPVEGTRRVNLGMKEGEQGKTSWRGSQVRVIADLWGDCLAVRKL